MKHKNNSSLILYPQSFGSKVLNVLCNGWWWYNHGAEWECDRGTHPQNSFNLWAVSETIT